MNEFLGIVFIIYWASFDITASLGLLALPRVDGYFRMTSSVALPTKKFPRSCDAEPDCVVHQVHERVLRDSTPNTLCIIF